MKRSCKAAKQELLPLNLPNGLVLGGLCRYYDQGWYHGYLDSVSDKDQTAKIRPIAANKAAAPNRVTIPLTDVLPVAPGAPDA